MSLCIHCSNIIMYACRPNVCHYQKTYKTGTFAYEWQSLCSPWKGCRYVLSNLYLSTTSTCTLQHITAMIQMMENIIVNRLHCRRTKDCSGVAVYVTHDSTDCCEGYTTALSDADHKYRAGNHHQFLWKQGCPVSKYR